MSSERLILFCTVALATSAVPAQQRAEVPSLLGPRQVLQSAAPTVESPADEPEDLKQMRRTKWIVTSVQRDGKTVPAQYGQRVGDVIDFKMDDTGKVILG